MTETLVPRLQTTHETRARSQAAFALARLNPGVPVLYTEVSKTERDAQSRVAGRVFPLVRNKDDFSGFTKTEGDVVRGYIVFNGVSEQPVAADSTIRGRVLNRSPRRVSDAQMLQRIVNARGSLITLTASSFTRTNKTPEQLRKQLVARQRQILHAARSAGLKVTTKIMTTSNTIRLDARLISA